MNLTIIIPYRRRAAHLVRFVPHMEGFLAGAAIRILVIEQADDKPFNRGALLNVGMSIVRESGSWAVLHDVDMLPEDSSCDYSPPRGVRHLAGALEQYGYRLPYLNYLGGVLATTVEAFESVNGYSNRYWGWGSEDDDFLLRLWVRGVPFERRPGRYSSLPHPPALPGLPNMKLIAGALRAAAITPEDSAGIDPRAFRRTPLEKYQRRAGAERVFAGDGLSSLSYRILETRQLARALPFAQAIGTAHELISVAL